MKPAPAPRDRSSIRAPDRNCAPPPKPQKEIPSLSRARLQLAAFDGWIVIVELQETTISEPPGSELSEPLPFPFNQQNFCRYESIEKTIETERVLIVDNLLRDEDDLSEIARTELGKDAKP